MKKQICVLFAMILSMQIFAQGLPCVPCQTKIVKPLPRVYFKKAPTLTTENSPCWQDSIVVNNYINVDNSNAVLGSQVKPQIPTINESIDQKTLATMNLIIIPNMYRTRGTLKIISGLGLQAIAVGMITYANIDSYHSIAVTTTQVIPYTYPEYKLNITPAVVSATTKCVPVPPVPVTPPVPPSTSNNTTSTSSSGSTSSSSSSATATAPTTVSNTNTNNNTTNVSTPVTVNVTLPTINNNINITVPTYTLTSTMKTGNISFTQTHQEVVIHHKNRTGYYIGAGALGLIGGALEVCGIIDFHHASVYISQNTIGVAIKF